MATESSPGSSDQGSQGTGESLPERGENPSRNKFSTWGDQCPIASGVCDQDGATGPDGRRTCTGDGRTSSVEGGTGPLWREQGSERGEQCFSRGEKGPPGRGEGSRGVEQDSSGERQQTCWLEKCTIKK